jgi:hypothetical protein
MHMRSYTGVKRFLCTEYNKSFMRSGDLKVHMRSNTVCNKSFSEAGVLNVHMRMGSLTGEKPIMCLFSAYTSPILSFPLTYSLIPPHLFSPSCSPISSFHLTYYKSNQSVLHDWYIIIFYFLLVF